MYKSIFNDVLGPVMRGPSSSHTAGSYHIARTIRDLLGEELVQADISFDRAGSYASTYAEQGADQAFATGFMGLDMKDPIFPHALENATAQGIQVQFRTAEIPAADHPNYAQIRVKGRSGRSLEATAKSTGGGTFLVTALDGLPVLLDGKYHVLLIRCQSDSAEEFLEMIRESCPGTESILRHTGGGEGMIQANAADPFPSGLMETLGRMKGFVRAAKASPLYYVKRGDAPFTSAAEMVAVAQQHNWSLGEAALRYEMALLGLNRESAVAEMLRRYDVMKRSAEAGFDDRQVSMLLLGPSAGRVSRGMEHNRSGIGGIHSRAAAIALAVMHSCNSRGIVCAAPTGGSAGTLPGTVIALEEAFHPDREALCRMLFAAGSIGLILAIRGTFAAEVAGCQVEIGAAGAMAAAAVAEYAGGSAMEACDAAAISFQNTMGSVCDLVQGICEIPCHTRNATAASSAFTNADLVLNGYSNPIPLDETIDAVYESGKMLPAALRCTAKGGIALAPSALKMKIRPGKI